MARMPRRRFQMANVASALVWAPAMLAPGYFAAKGLEELAMLGETNQLAPVLIIAAAVLGLVLLVWRILIKRQPVTAPLI